MFVREAAGFVGRLGGAFSQRGGTARKHAGDARGTTISMREVLKDLPRHEVRMKPATRDVCVSFAAISILFVALLMADPRVRERVGDLRPSVVSSQLAAGTGQLASAGVSARDLLLEHDTMTIFVVAGTVLVAGMLPT